MKTILLSGLLLSAHLLRAQAVSTSAGASPTQSITVVSTIPASAVETRAPSRPSVPASEKAIVETERQRFAALIAKNYAVLEKVLADDLIYTHSLGNNDTKQAYIQAIRDGKLRYDAIDVEEQTIRLYGNTAVVNGLCMIKATNNGETISTRLRYIDVYVRRGNQWQMVAWQSLRLNK